MANAQGQPKGSSLEWIERYEIPSDRETHDGWAIVHIDSKGFLGVVGAHGNYAYHWSNFEGGFKHFLESLDWHYLYCKITHQQKVYDGYDTLEAIRGELKEQLASGNLSDEQFAEETELLQGLEIEDSECGFRDWCRETKLVEPWHLGLAQYRPDLQCEMFCKNIWPKFIALLKEGRCTPLGGGQHG